MSSEAGNVLLDRAEWNGAFTALSERLAAWPSHLDAAITLR